MSVRHARWLVAKGNVFAPSAVAVGKLVEKLREERFLPDPKSPSFAALRFVGPRDAFAARTGGYAVRTVENVFGEDEAARIIGTTEAQPAELTKDWLDDGDREELRLVWPVNGEAIDLAHPLTFGTAKPYAIEIHRALEYVVPALPGIGALDATCRCGEDLSFEWDADEVVPAFASSSGVFAECDACSRTFDPATSSATIENPFDRTKKDTSGGAAYRFALKFDGEVEPDPSLSFAPALVALLEKEFGRSFYEVGAIVS